MSAAENHHGGNEMTRIALILAGLLLAAGPVQADPAAGRTPLQGWQVPADGPYDVTTLRGVFPPGASSGRHHHEGAELTYLVAGEVTLKIAGQPDRVMAAGDSVLIAPDTVHEAISTGAEPAIALITFVTRRGRPLVIKDE